ncbi:hypothetical protein NUH16_000728 [Penicillium rubens]|uniref:Uncharacterized protein n=2 Tax=Penicillium rubens TaxID=1108849 RepID=B6HSP1_PENRW|nr:hypothetical protein NUH16_000728 [Penicillium rubens]CAP98133.1 hypothetical protein PCH_Pc22g08450 [Penicillium rubens Wisconsin 54-1255]
MVRSLRVSPPGTINNLSGEVEEMIGERTRSDIRRSGEVASEINVGSHVDDKGRHPEGDVRDDEIGDVLEDIVIGPEGKDVDIISEGDTITNNQDDPEIVIPDSQDDAEIDDFGRLWMTMRATIQYLQEYSRANNIIGLDSGERPLSLSYWRLLCRVNVDWITRPLMEAIPPVGKNRRDDEYLSFMADFGKQAFELQRRSASPARASLGTEVDRYYGIQVSRHSSPWIMIDDDDDRWMMEKKK